VWLKCDKLSGHLHENVSTFMMVSRLTVPGSRNKRCSENNNTLRTKYIFFKSCMYEIIMKNATKANRPRMIEHNAVRNLPSGELRQKYVKEQSCIVLNAIDRMKLRS
jgi:hypothetical protein